MPVIVHKLTTIGLFFILPQEYMAKIQNICISLLLFNMSEIVAKGIGSLKSQAMIINIVYSYVFLGYKTHVVSLYFSHGLSSLLILGMEQ